MICVAVDIFMTTSAETTKAFSDSKATAATLQRCALNELPEYSRVPLSESIEMATKLVPWSHMSTAESVALCKRLHKMVPRMHLDESKHVPMPVLFFESKTAIGPIVLDRANVHLSFSVNGLVSTDDTKQQMQIMSRDTPARTVPPVESDSDWIAKCLVVLVDGSKPANVCLGKPELTYVRAAEYLEFGKKPHTDTVLVWVYARSSCHIIQWPLVACAHDLCGLQRTPTHVLRRCGGCRDAWYCGKKCQKADYVHHRGHCKKHMIKKDTVIKLPGKPDVSSSSSSSSSHHPVAATSV